MFKRIVFFFYIIIISSVCFAQRTGEMIIGDGSCQYDTLQYRHIAPGTTFTQFQFNNIKYNGLTYKMKVHLITIDQTNPYNSFSAYMAKDKFYNINTQIQEVAREKALGKKAVASMTGPFFVQSVKSDPTLTLYEVNNSLIMNSSVKYSSKSSTCFYIGKDKLAHDGIVHLNAKVTVNGTSYDIDNINHHRDKSEAGNLTLFCNGVPSSLAVSKETGTDVRLKLIDADQIKSGTATKCKITDIIDGCGNTVGNGEAMLSGTGDAETFLRNLKIGDEVSITINYTDADNNTIDAEQLITTSDFYSVHHNEVVPIATKNYAWIAIGRSEDGKTIYLSDFEISPNSNAPANCYSYFLKDLGVYNAIWLDGGPSAETTIDGAWVSTNSIGYGFNGRYMPAGLMVYSIAPDDSELVSLENASVSTHSMNVGESWTISLYGYNQYGEMIMKDAQTSDNVEITCPEGLGTIEKGVFTATKGGSGFLNIKVKGHEEVLRVALTVTDKRSLDAYPKSLFTGEGRNCQLKLNYTDANGTKEISAKDAVWSTTSRYVVKRCKDGLIMPYIDGMADVYVTYDGLCDTVHVTVENLDTLVNSLDLTDKLEDLSSIHYQLPSVPKSIQVDVTGEPETVVSLYYTLGDGQTYIKTDTFSTDGTLTLEVTFDYNKVDTYPVTLTSLVGASKDVACTLTRLVAYYNDIDGIESTESIDTTAKSLNIYTITGQRVKSPLHGINIINGKKAIVK